MSRLIRHMSIPSVDRSPGRGGAAIPPPDLAGRADAGREPSAFSPSRGTRLVSRFAFAITHLVVACALGAAGISTTAHARFLSPDPAPVNKTDGSNFNRYWYANNNPYKYVDPDGRESGCIHGGGCGGMPSPTQNAVFGAAMDFVPGIGDVKGVVEAVQEPSPTNILSALADVIPVIGNAVGDTIKAIDKAQDASRNTRKADQRAVARESASSKGTPGSNKAQNRQFRDATRGLGKEERARVHREISGQNLGYREIKEIADDIKK